MKHINFDIVKATEAAAIAASKWIGSGDKLAADKDASSAMKERLDQIDFCGEVVICEFKKDNSFGIEGYVGKGKDFRLIADDYHPYDLAIDPIEGTTPTVNSGPEAISTIAIAKGGCMKQLDCFYVNKMAYGPDIFSKVELSISDPIEKTCIKISKATGKPLDKIMVCILNRPRHESIINKLRAIGVRIKLIQDCDVSGAIAACLPNSGIDLLYGIGGAPEAVISAAAIKCLKGDFQVQIVDDKMLVIDETLCINDLVQGECCFIATGITDGSMLKGVRYTSRGAVTNSVFMRSESGTIRWLTAEHGN